MGREIVPRMRKIAERLKKKYNAERVILYGSYAKGEATEHSDIDILVVAPTKEPFYQRMATVLSLLRDLYQELPISPIVLKPEEIETRRNRGDQFVEEILREGIEL
jgi:predicted nucleotidyltransferase